MYCLYGSLIEIIEYIYKWNICYFKVYVMYNIYLILMIIFFKVIFFIYNIFCFMGVG